VLKKSIVKGSRKRKLQANGAEAVRMDCLRRDPSISLNRSLKSLLSCVSSLFGFRLLRRYRLSQVIYLTNSIRNAAMQTPSKAKTATGMRTMLAQRTVWGKRLSGRQQSSLGN